MLGEKLLVKVWASLYSNNSYTPFELFQHLLHGLKINWTALGVYSKNFKQSNNELKEEILLNKSEEANLH